MNRASTYQDSDQVAWVRLSLDVAQCSKWRLHRAIRRRPGGEPKGVCRVLNRSWILTFLCPLYTRTSGVVCFSRDNRQRNVGQCASWALPRAKPRHFTVYKRYYEYLFI